MHTKTEETGGFYSKTFMGDVDALGKLLSNEPLSQRVRGSRYKIYDSIRAVKLLKNQNVNFPLKRMTPYVYKSIPKYRKVPKISPGAYFLARNFWRAYFRGVLKGTRNPKMKWVSDERALAGVHFSYLHPCSETLR